MGIKAEKQMKRTTCSDCVHFGVDIENPGPPGTGQCFAHPPKSESFLVPGSDGRPRPVAFTSYPAVKNRSKSCGEFVELHISNGN